MLEKSRTPWRASRSFELFWCPTVVAVMKICRSLLTGEAHVDVGVMTSTALLVLDLRESAAAPIELALVLGTLLLCGDCPSPVRSGGVGTAEVDVSIGGGARLFNRCCACGGGGGGGTVV